MTEFTRRIHELGPDYKAVLGPADTAVLGPATKRYRRRHIERGKA